MPSDKPYVLTGQDLWEWRNTTAIAAGKANISVAEIDWFLRELLEIDQLTLRLCCSPSATEVLAPLSLQQIDQLWQRRVRESLPVQYLLGVTPWRDLKLRVCPDVLIPRPETELIVDLALKLLQDNQPFTCLDLSLWADLGTGSGAIALGLAQLLSNAQIYAVDISENALAIAQHNAEQLTLPNPIMFRHGSWWLPLDEFKGHFRGMVSNPPYIPTDMIADLQAEVALHEPHLALDGGKDGLDALRCLIVDSPNYLMTDGLWLVEIMAGQADAVVRLLSDDGRYDQIQVHQDLAGIDRFISARVIT